VAIDSGNSQITIDSAELAAGDKVIISSISSTGFINLQVTLDTEISFTANSKTFAITVVAGGVFADISLQDNVTRASGDMILLDAKRGSGDIPTIAGYDNLAGFTDTPLLSGNNTQENWSLTQKGIFFDAMGTIIYARSEVAPFVPGATPSSFNDEFWKTKASSLGSTMNTITERKGGVRYYKRFGENSIFINGVIDSSGTTTDVIASHTATVTFEIRATENGSVLVSGTKELNKASGSTSSASEFTINMDITNLSDNTFYYVMWKLTAEVDGSSSQPNNELQETIAKLREDILIRTTT
jgi:hypothetical protein